MRPLRLLAPAFILAGLTPAFAQDGDIIKAHGIAAYGEPKLPADFKNLAYVNPDAPKGGEISEWWLGGFDSYNPYSIKGRGELMSTIMIENLMEGTADEVGTAYCLICESIEYPKSRDWVIFNLRPEAKFSDGTPVTAQDALFSYETLRDKGLSSFRAVISQQVEKAEVLDDHRLKFTFAPGYPRRDLIQTVGGLPVFSRADFEKNNRDFAETSGIPYVGSGPYVFDRGEIGRTAVYKRNPDYWGKDLPINKGRHNFDRIRIEYFADSDSAFEAFKSGAYTFRNESSATTWSTGYTFPGVKNGWVVKQNLDKGSKANAQGFYFNLRRDKFKDIRVREAIGLLFNFEWSNETLFHNMYKRTNSFWENSDLQATGKPSEGELALLTPIAKDLPEAVLTDDAVMAPVSGKRQLDRANLRKASALLDEAGWKPGKDGIRRNDKNEPLRVEFLNDNPQFDRVINPFVQNLRAIGIDAVLTNVDNAQMTNRERSFDFDIIVSITLTDMLPSADLEQTFKSNNAQGEFNPMGLANPAIDKLVDLTIAAGTEEEMVTRVRALDRALRSLRFWVPNYYSPTYNVAYYDQYGHPETLPPFALGELDFWWFDADKAQKLKAAGALR